MVVDPTKVRTSTTLASACLIGLSLTACGTPSSSTAGSTTTAAPTTTTATPTGAPLLFQSYDGTTEKSTLTLVSASGNVIAKTSIVGKADVVARFDDGSRLLASTDTASEDRIEGDEFWMMSVTGSLLPIDSLAAKRLNTDYDQEPQKSPYQPIEGHIVRYLQCKADETNCGTIHTLDLDTGIHDSFQLPPGRYLGTNRTGTTVYMIAYSYDDDEMTLRSYDVAARKQLTQSPIAAGALNGHPRLSPTGATLMWADPLAGIIHIVHVADGSEKTVAINNKTTNALQGWVGWAYGALPTWSPDGKRLAFLDTDQVQNFVWVIDASGSATNVLAENRSTPQGAAYGSVEVSELGWRDADTLTAGIVVTGLSFDTPLRNWVIDVPSKKRSSTSITNGVLVGTRDNYVGG